MLFRTAWRGQRVDAHLVPRSGPVLVVANHLGFLDGPFVFSMVPRRAHFIIKKQTFSGPMGALMEGVGQIPLDRSVADRAALGSALATIGLTIPSVAVVSIYLKLPLVLGLPSKEIVLLFLTLLASAITLAGGRATVLQGTVHLVIFAAFLFLAVVP